MVDRKPKTLIRKPNEILISWDSVYNSEEKSNFIVQISNDIKEWKTIYCGNRSSFKVVGLAPCTCYSFRIKLENGKDWINFKAATEDLGPYTSTMHISRAVKLSKTHLIRKIVHNRPHLLEAENKENKTPLIQAIEVGDINIVQLLITLGTNLNTPLFFNHRTPLMMAIYKGQLQIATLLIDKGADIHLTDVNGLNILHYAVDSNNVRNVKFCLEFFKNINRRDNNGWTPLIRAAIFKSSPDIIDELIKHGADPTIKDKHGFDFKRHMEIH